MTKIIDVIIHIEAVDHRDAILPEEHFCPTKIEIFPAFLNDGTINFRVKFEPENVVRRQQPLRRTMNPAFQEN